MRYPIIILLPLLLLLGGSQLHAQSGDSITVVPNQRFSMTGGAFIGMALPVGKFHNKTNSLWGGGFRLLAGPVDFPVKAGISFETLVLDRRLGSFTVATPGFEPETYETRAASFTNIGTLLLRVEPDLRIFPVQPYIEGIFGFSHFITAHALYLKDNEDDHIEFPYYEDYRSRERSDWTQTYGGALGIQLALPLSTEEAPAYFVLDARFAYQRGGVAKYMVLDRQLTVTDFPIDSFADEQSATDMMLFHVGAGFRF